MGGVQIRDLTVVFRDGVHDVRPLADLTFDVAPGQLVVVLGASGSGKTTLLSCLAGILRPSSGSIVVDDVDVSRLNGTDLDDFRRRRVGLIYQAFNLVPSLTATENVAMQLVAQGTPRREAMRCAAAQLETMGLGARLGHRPGRLSGGEQQRVAIARAVVHGPSLVLADEPTAHLDYAAAEVVLRALRSLADRGHTVIISTHDARLLPIADGFIDLQPTQLGVEHHREQIALAGGDLIFDEGDVSDFVYRVIEGEVELVRYPGTALEELLRICGPGEYFGELGPLLGFPRSAAARARTSCALDALGIAEFRATAGVARPGATDLMKAVSG